MASKGIRIATLVLRVLSLALLAGSIAFLATNNFTLNDGTTKTTFKDIIAYRYVIATAILGFLYTLVQIPFVIYHVCTEKRLIRHACLPEFDFFGDKVIAFLLATGVGAGFAVSFELKKLFKQFVERLEALGATGLEEAQSKTEKFLDKGNIATGILFLGFLCMAMLSVLSSISVSSMNRTTETNRAFFGWRWR